MNLLTADSLSYISSLWKEKYTVLLEDEHWSTLQAQFNRCITEKYPQTDLPYFNEEVTPPKNEIQRHFTSAYELSQLNDTTLTSEIIWARVIEEAPFEYILIILGQRLTSASITDERAIPPSKKTLKESALMAYNDQISVATRAWEKHAGRSTDNFWGEIKGNAAQKNEHVTELISTIIQNKTWWNIFFHYKHGLVYEIRNCTGHGIRWNKDGTELIGFLEPFVNA